MNEKKQEPMATDDFLKKYGNGGYSSWRPIAVQVRVATCDKKDCNERPVPCKFCFNGREEEENRRM